MAIYLIDFENVHDDGLEGIRTLAKEDKVIIFYGIKIKSISFDRHVEIMSTNAHVEYVKTNKIAKNYLDFQLATYLGFVIGRGEKGPVYIISKDTGYDSIVDYWKCHNIKIDRRNSIQGENTVIRQPAKTPAKPPARQGVKPGTKQPANAGTAAGQSANVSSVSLIKLPVKTNTQNLPEAYRKKVRTAVKEDKLSASSYTTIYKAIIANKEKQDFNRELVKSFGQDKGNLIYNRVKDILTEYHNKGKQVEKGI